MQSYLFQSASTLKKVAKVAAKHGRKRKGSSDEEFVDECSDKGSYHGGRSSEESHSDDSDDDENHSRSRGEDEVMLACLDFFNSATSAQLLSTSRMNDRIVSQIIDNRPFKTFKNLVRKRLLSGCHLLTIIRVLQEASISMVPRGVGALNAYMELLENRGVLEKILDDCKDHSEAVAEDFERCTNRRIELKFLDDKSAFQYLHFTCSERSLKCCYRQM